MSTPTPKNMFDLVGIIGAVRRDAQKQAATDRASGELTLEGLKIRHHRWGIDRKWAELVDDAEARAQKVVADRTAKLAKLRDKVTAPPTDVNARMLGEMVFARRRHLVDTLLSNPAHVSEIAAHIESAPADEVPVLVEYLRDEAAARRESEDSVTGSVGEHPFAESILVAVDKGVDARHPDIAPAVEALSAAEQAAENVDVQAQHTRAALADPDYEVPAYVEMWANSDNFGGIDIAV